MHGSFYNKNYKKILIIFLGKWNVPLREKMLEDSKTKFKDYVIFKN
jgi:hypothetical protein